MIPNQLNTTNLSLRPFASVGYGIHAKLRGRGLCVEAVAEVLDRAFSEYAQLNEVDAYTDPANSASIRVLNKLGFAESPVAPEDGTKFCISRPDWEIRK